MIMLLAVVWLSLTIQELSQKGLVEKAILCSNCNFSIVQLRTLISIKQWGASGSGFLELWTVFLFIGVGLLDVSNFNKKNMPSTSQEIL